MVGLLCLSCLILPPLYIHSSILSFSFFFLPLLSSFVFKSFLSFIISFFLPFFYQFLSLSPCLSLSRLNWISITACSLSLNIVLSFHSIVKSFRDLRIDMPSLTSYATAALAVMLPFTTAQTYSKCNPTESVSYHLSQ